MKTQCTIVLIFALLIGSVSAQAPDFSPNHDLILCGPNDVYFVCTSPQDPQNIWWDFGDGTTATGLTPTHFYSTTGVYNVKLITEKNGVKDSIVKTAFVTVNPVPEAKFERETPQTHQPFRREFKFTGFSNSDSMLSYEWRINDTLVASSQDLVYVFPRSDWFVVTLDIVNSKGCSGHTSDSVYISGLDGQVGLNEQQFRDDLAITLTPDQQQVFINRASGTTEQLKVVLYDITGKIEYSGVLPAGEHSWSFDVSGLTPGLHLIVVNNRSYVAAKKLQKYML